MHELDHSAVRPYADHLDDGLVQLSFTLPVPYSLAARRAALELGRRIVVVGASTGSDTHSVGIDAMLNLKGYHGHHGLEGYRCFETHNLGSQVPNSVLVARAIDVGADAILVSQTVTQQNLHV